MRATKRDTPHVLVFTCRACSALYGERPTSNDCPACGYDGDETHTGRVDDDGERVLQRTKWFRRTELELRG